MTVGEHALDELAFGPPDGPRRRWPAVVAAVVVGRRRGGGSGRAGAGAQRCRPALCDRTLPVRRLIAEDSGAATVRYASPAIVLLKTPEPVRRDLRRLVGEAAASGLRATACAPVSEMKIRAWHGGLERGRAAYVSYLDQRVSRLANRRSGPETYERTVQLRTRAHDALLIALGPERADRVEQALAR